jgi:hypothetical protein
MFREHTHDPDTGKAVGADRSHGSVLPKILAVVAVINLLRMVARHRGGGSSDASSWRDRRKSMIAELHRELHRADDEQENASADETAKA